MTIETRLPDHARPIPVLDELWSEAHPGRRNDDAVARGRAFAGAFKAEGAVCGIKTIDRRGIDRVVADLLARGVAL